MQYTPYLAPLVLLSTFRLTSRDPVPVIPILFAAVGVVYPIAATAY